MTDQVFTKYIDDAHGWLEVHISDIKQLRIIPDISGLSCYVDSKGFVYLEEDCDQPLFEEAYERLYGKKPKIIYDETYSKPDAPDCFIYELDSWSRSSYEAIKSKRRPKKR